MEDMLVRLYDLPDSRKLISKLEEENIKIIRALSPDKYPILDWIEKHSSIFAKGEASVCFSNKPISIFLAVKEKEIIGYACYNATKLNFFGPTRVLDTFQGKGIGKALLIEALKAMRNEGYGYAIIGGVGPKDFYKKCVNAIEIPGSNPGIYKDFLGMK
ncbi:MAG: GNAT family N-acetyltransferase [Pleomorphochaeta sp.]